MSGHMIPLYAGSGFFAVMIILLPLCCARKGPNQGIIRCSIVIALVSMWIFWATVFIAQMNPLIGPRHKNTTLIWYKQAELFAGLLKEEKNTDVARAPAGGDETVLRSLPSHCHSQPNNLFECCNIPWLPKRAKSKCIGDSVDILKLTCEEARCAFQEANWFEPERVDVVKLPALSAFYDTVEKNDPNWAQAVRHIKEECLVTNLKYQGMYTDCPAYDVLYCVAIRMLKNAPLLSWSTAAACLPTQEFLGVCPLCPTECNVHILMTKTAYTIKCQACMSV